MPRNAAPNIARIIIANAIPMASKIRVAFAQFAFEEGMLLLNAHTNNIIKPTNGMAVISSVINQSLKERDSFLMVSVASIIVFNLLCSYSTCNT